ncbi:MAG: CPBP family intramembrane metalloprotease [Eubacteriaceae bacterium]|nr:CPBP family intramembrane metalloprotease [Eubacteriaceae bacterium]
MNSDLNSKSIFDAAENTPMNELKPIQEEQINQPKIQPTKKELRHDILTICIALGAYIISVNVLVVIIAAIAVAVNSDVQKMILDIVKQGGGSLLSITGNTEYINAVSQVVAKVMGPAYIISAVVSVLWMLTIRKKKLFTTDITTIGQKVKPFVIAKILVLIWGVQFVSSMITMILNPALENAGISLTDAMQQSIGMLFATPMGIAAAVFVVPVIEEIIFRGAIMRKLERYGTNFAIIVSSLLFAVYHMIWLQAFFAFFVGLLLAYTAKRFSIKWSMLLHILNNGIAAIITISAVSEIFELSTMIACAIGSAVILIIGRNKISLIKEQGKPNIASPFKIAFSHPMFIITAVILLGIGALTLGM